jgi:hypothetical protein
MSMSRDGDARPVPTPARATTAMASVDGNQPVDASSSRPAAPAMHSAIVRSRRSARATRKPPRAMPTAPQIM